jgi:hypothetical protein
VLSSHSFQCPRNVGSVQRHGVLLGRKQVQDLLSTVPTVGRVGLDEFNYLVIIFEKWLTVTL